jgi:pimeloyl-ACP methyl ester carboxylesterase
MRAMTTGIVLVHGACHGPWCWDKVVPLLTERGLRVATPDLYSGPSPTDAAVVQADVDRLREDGPVVVCGHSFGGLPITALDPTTVDHLVYLAAFLPDREPWFTDTPVKPDFFTMVEFVDGVMRTKPDRARELFYADCADDDVAWAISRLGDHPSGEMPAVARPAWREVPATYVCCDEDNTLTRDYMNAAIERVGRGVHWPTSHSPMISQPHLVAELLADLAARLPED